METDLLLPNKALIGSIVDCFRIYQTTFDLNNLDKRIEEHLNNSNNSDNNNNSISNNTTSTAITTPATPSDLNSILKKMDNIKKTITLLHQRSLLMEESKKEGISMWNKFQQLRGFLEKSVSHLDEQVANDKEI